MSCVMAGYVENIMVYSSHQLNRWDAGVTGIIDYFFKPEKNMRSLRLSLTYYYGLTDMLKDNTGDAWNNSIFLLSIGIPVGASSDSK